jgi:acyl-coenzyme A thioesterase PaaI-like protein
MDYEAVRQGMEQAIPYNRYLGLEVSEVGDGRGTVRLPQDERLHNHVGSQHAGALFSAGEAASGGAFLAAFAKRLADVTPLAEGAEIAYRRVARGPVTATARLDAAPEDLLAELDREGRVRFPIAVALTDGEDELVAEMTVRWYVRARA